MTDIKHIFFDIGGVLGSNGWDHEQRERAVKQFQLNEEDFEWRHKEVVAEWEEGRITMDEYLDIAVFHTARTFSHDEFVQFMYSQSIPDEATIAIARELTRESGFTMMTLNNEAEELNRYRIDKFGISQIFEAFLSSCWLGIRKPSRLIFERALGIAQAKADQALFVDDRSQNTGPARSLGFVTHHFTTAPLLEKTLTALNLL